jgi:hypothetical protein
MQITFDLRCTEHQYTNSGTFSNQCVNFRLKNYFLIVLLLQRGGHRLQVGILDGNKSLEKQRRMYVCDWVSDNTFKNKKWLGQLQGRIQRCISEVPKIKFRVPEDHFFNNFLFPRSVMVRKSVYFRFHSNRKLLNHCLR